MLAGLRYRTTSILSASRHYQCRHFFSFPSAEPTTFSVTQRFDYPPSLIYGVVSDVQHYSDFVPFCEGSTITKTDGDGNPVEAVLKVGWNQFNEEFASKIECVKDKSVVSSAPDHSMFSVLYSKWTISPSQFSEDACNVKLDLEFQFKNTMYNMVSSQFAPAVSQVMVDAFTKRAHVVALQEKRKLN